MILMLKTIFMILKDLDADFFEDQVYTCMHVLQPIRINSHAFSS